MFKVQMPGPKGAKARKGATGGTKGPGASKPRSGSSNTSQKNMAIAEERVDILERENMMLRKKLNIAEIKKEFQKSGVQESDLNILFYESLHDLELKLQQYESNAGEQVRPAMNVQEEVTEIEKLRAVLRDSNKKVAAQTTNLKELIKSLDQTKMNLQETEATLQATEKYLEARNKTVKQLKEEKQQSSIGTEKDVIAELRKPLSDKDKVIEGLQKRNTALEISTENERSLREKTEEDLKAKLAVAQRAKEWLKGENEKMEITIQKLRRERPMIDPKLLVEKCERTENELQKAKEEIDELKNGRSKVVGANIMKDNPDITDLSDENRPTKLSEKFSELFDNEWVDAYEEVENEYNSEKKIIAHLYKTLEDIFDFCKEISEEHAKTIQACVLTVPYALKGRPKSAKTGFTHQRQLKELRKGFAPYLVDHVFEIGFTHQRQLKELRKDFAPYLVDHVFEHFVHTMKINLAGKKKTENFMKRCVEICWLMNSQDPPVILDKADDKGKEFDGDKFRTYTKSGILVDYVVWPPMLLHKDGPLLCKGVAQGK